LNKYIDLNENNILNELKKISLVIPRINKLLSQIERKNTNLYSKFILFNEIKLILEITDDFLIKQIAYKNLINEVGTNFDSYKDCLNPYGTMKKKCNLWSKYQKNPKENIINLIKDLNNIETYYEKKIKINNFDIIKNLVKLRNIFINFDYQFKFIKKKYNFNYIKFKNYLIYHIKLKKMKLNLLK
jgi:hypothetical protein